MLAGVLMSGSTPESGGAGAAERYAQFWADDDNQAGAWRGSVTLTYAVPLLLAFTASLSRLLRRGDDGPLPSLVLAAGATAAALLGVGQALVNGAGHAAKESGYVSNGQDALLLEAVGYFTLVPSIMCAAVMAVAVSVSNRTGRVLPSWTAVLSGLLGLAALGSIFTAWAGFMLLPLWSVVVGATLLVQRNRTAAVDDRVPVPS